MKRSNGITLIALVITIIVLLMLAGVTIVILTSDNGLMTKASEAKTATEKSAFREEIDLILLQSRMGDLESAFKTADSKSRVNKVNGVYEVNYKGEDILISDDYRYIEKVEANPEEWTFDARTQTLTEYKGDLTTKRGNQEVGELIIPNYYNGKRVKILAINLFYNNSQKSHLTKITISDGIETISAGAFTGCGKIGGNLVIPDSVTYIGGQAFASCTSLNGILKLSHNLEYIGGLAFGYDENIKGDLIIPDSVTYIGTRAFQSMGKLDGTLKLSSNLEIMESQVFYGDNKLKGDIIIPEQVEEIGMRTFYGCSSISSITILNKNIEIKNINETHHDTFHQNIKLRGYKDSTTKIYADNYGLKFEEI